MTRKGAIFRTFDPTDTEGLPKKIGFHITLFVLAILLLPAVFFMPNKEGKIAVFILYLASIIWLALTIKFYNWKYRGGAEIKVSKEVIEIKQEKYPEIVFSINSIREIAIWDKPNTEGPNFNFFTICTSSPLGNVKLRFIEDVGKQFLKEILKYKQTKRKVSSKLKYWLFSELERYYF